MNKWFRMNLLLVLMIIKISHSDSRKPIRNNWTVFMLHWHMPSLVAQYVLFVYCRMKYVWCFRVHNECISSLRSRANCSRSITTTKIKKKKRERFANASGLDHNHHRSFNMIISSVMLLIMFKIHSSETHLQ